jgi:hypothetical protein
MIGLCQPVLTQTGLEVDFERCQWAHSASCAAVMAWISTNSWYIISTPSVVGGGKALSVLVTAALVWPSSRLAKGGASLARACVAAKSTTRILYTSGVVKVLLGPRVGFGGLITNN